MQFSLCFVFKRLRLLRVARVIASILALLAGTSLQASNIGRDWALVSPLPTANYFNDIAWTGSLLVAVGQGGVVMTSPDGVNWSLSKVDTYPYSLAWSGSELLMGTANAGHVMTSPDGLVWTEQETNYPGELTKVQRFAGKYYALGQDWSGPNLVQHFLSSFDGITWTSSVLPVTNEDNLQGFTLTGSNIVVVGNHYNDSTGNSSSKILSSTNGATWTSASLGGDDKGGLTAVVWTGSKAVAVGYSGGVYTSTNGASPWTKQVLDPGNPDYTPYLNDVLWDGSKLVAVGYGNALNSPDGVTWSLNFPYPFSADAVVEADGHYVAVGSAGSIYTSPDAATWTKRSPQGNNENQFGVVWTGTQFVSVGNWPASVQTSPDGDTWTAQAPPAGYYSTIGGVTWTGSQLVAVGSGSVFTSSTGVTWAESILSTDVGNLSAVASTASLIVAVGSLDYSSGWIVTSSDAAVWATASLPSGVGQLYAVARTSTLWVAVGENGVILTSSNGSLWTKRTSGTTNELHCIATNGSTIVVGGQDGTLLSSTNGTTWVKQSRLADNYSWVDSLVWMGTDFVASIDNGKTVATSTNGTNWTLRETGFEQPIYGMAWNGSKLIAVGESGVVLKSTGLPLANVVAASQTAVESDGSVPVLVTLSFPSDAPVTVNYSISGSAVSGTDYTVLSGSLTFAAGETSKAIIVSLLPNSTVEAAKDLILTITSSSTTRLGDNLIHTLTIQDDDSPPPVSFHTSALEVHEVLGGVIGVAVDLGWAPGAPVSVNLNVAGTANNADFSGVPATLNFAAGETSKTIAIVLTDDPLAESDETIILNLGSLGNGVAGAFTSYTLTIKDNDSGPNPGSNWTRRNPLPDEGLISVASQGSRRVIVGDDGLIITSDDDGVTWTPRFSGPITPNDDNHINDVISTGSMFVAVGHKGRVFTSIDGTAWVQRTITGAQNVRLQSIAWSGSKFVAVGWAEDTTPAHVNRPSIFTSTDAVRWTNQALPQPEDVAPFAFIGEASGVAWTGTQFVVVGGNYDWDDNTQSSFAKSNLILTSPDGQVWTDHSDAIPATPDGGFENVVWAGSTIGLVAMDGDKDVFTSSDGIHWFNKVTGPLVGIESGAYNGTQFLGVGRNTVTTVNGTNWNQYKNPIPNYFVDVAVTNTGYMAIADAGSILTSTDGKGWIKKSTGIDPGGDTVAVGVVWSGKQFVAVGGGDSTLPVLVMTSQDGIEWSQQTTPANGLLVGIAWSGSTFVAVGYNGVIITSPDGKTWTKRTSGSALHLHGVAWVRGQFIAVGGNEEDEDGTNIAGGSIVLTSPNGITWTRRTIPTLNPLEGITSNDNTIVVTARGQTILTSNDGINWLVRVGGPYLAGTDVDFHSVAWSDTLGLYVTSNDSGAILRSPDGITWTAASSVPPEHSTVNSAAGICWVGTHFVTVGANGSVLTSPDGDVWTEQYTSVTDTLYGLAWNGTVLVATGVSGTIITSGEGAAPTPSAQFAANASSFGESGGAANVLVTMSSAPSTMVTLNIGVDVISTATSAAGALADVTMPTMVQLVFNPGESSKYLSIPVKSDLRAEGNETLVLNLNAPTSGATLGTLVQHTLTIIDDDFAPSISIGGAPAHQLVELGQPIILTVNAGGTLPLKYAWKKGTATVAGATGPVLYIAKAAFTNAGDYTCSITNSTGIPATSAIAQIGIFEKLDRRIANASSKDVVLTQAFAGNNLSVTWNKDDGIGNLTPISDTAHTVLTSTATSKTLTIKASILAGDLGSYRCTILQTDSSLLDNANRYEVLDAAVKPTLSAITLPAGQVGFAYSQSVTSASTGDAVESWTATGLPKGLSLNAFTGEITGYPTTAGTSKVTLTATNSIDKTSVVITGGLVINALPSTLVGKWNGLVARELIVNQNLGSRLELSFTALGGYTGKLFTGTASIPLAGQLDIVSSGSGPSTTFVISADTGFIVNGSTQAQLSFSVDTSVSPLALTGTFSLTPPTAVGPSVANLTGWHARNSFTGFAGKHNFALDLDTPFVGDVSAPQGTGFGIATVTATGAVTTAGKLSDGTPYTSSSTVGTSGECLLYVSLYGGHGSLMGTPAITLVGSSPFDASTLNDLVSTATTWSKEPDLSVKGALNYPSGWQPITLILGGQRYIAPAAKTPVMGITDTSGSDNAIITMSEADLPGPIDTDVAIKATGTIGTVVSNPLKLTLTVTNSTGAIKGKMTLSQSVNGTFIKRDPVNYEGLIIPNRCPSESLPDEGVGFFSLQQLPDANLSPLPDATKMPKLSGKVSLVPQ